VTKHKQFSDETAEAIDQEVRSIIDKNYRIAEKILKDKINILHLMAEALIKYETLDAHQIQDIMEGREPRPPAHPDDDRTRPKAASADTTVGPASIGEESESY
jgi:cell division protease FtsH